MFYRCMILYAVTNIILCYVDNLYVDGMKLNFNGYIQISLQYNLSSSGKTHTSYTFILVTLMLGTT